MDEIQHVRASKISAIIPLLAVKYPATAPLLSYGSCFELMVAVVLSAQCTDARVNMITPALFARFPDAGALAEAKQKEVESIIHSAGFYQVKAKYLISGAAMIAKEFGGRVPSSMEDLLKIPGIGRKSANVLRGHCFGLPAIIVDTHFGRVTKRIGLTSAADPGKVEKELAELGTGPEQTAFSMRINLHGRSVCTSRKPKCSECFLKKYCDFKADPG